MMMRLTLTQAVTLLKEHDLLIKVVNPQVTEFTAVTYDSRHIPAGQPLFFLHKNPPGAFRAHFQPSPISNSQAYTSSFHPGAHSWAKSG